MISALARYDSVPFVLDLFEGVSGQFFGGRIEFGYSVDTVEISVESIVSDGCDGRRNGDECQGDTTAERILSDGCGRIRNGEGSEGSAVGERIGSDGRDGTGEDDGLDLRLVRSPGNRLRIVIVSHRSITGYLKCSRGGVEVIFYIISAIAGILQIGIRRIHIHQHNVSEHTNK